MQARPVQYTLAALFALLTAASVVLAYSRYVGFWGLVVALGPPLVMGAAINLLFTSEFGIFLSSKRLEELREAPRSALSALVALILGFALWIPILLALCLR